MDVLTENDRQKCIKEIVGYFYDERGETIGVIAAENILDFFLQIAGPDVYNKAVEDTKIIFKKRIEELDVELDLLKRQE